MNLLDLISVGTDFDFLNSNGPESSVEKSESVTSGPGGLYGDLVKGKPCSQVSGRDIIVGGAISEPASI